MAYIGRDIDKISNVEVLDNITFDGSSSYTLQKGGSNFTPSSANTLLVSIDGVVQAGNFTVSGSTINFGTAVSASSTCNFILHYGVGLITTPADGTVTTAKLANTSVTPAKMDLSQNYTFTGAVSGHNYPAFHASRTSNQTISNGTNTTIIFDTEIFDTDSAYNTATGTFTVPTGKDGKYVLYAAYRWQSGATFAYNLKLFKNTVEFTNANGGNNSSYNSNLLFVVADLSAGDNLVATAFQDSGGNVDLTGSGITTYFGAYRIGA